MPFFRACVVPLMVQGNKESEHMDLRKSFHIPKLVLLHLLL